VALGLADSLDDDIVLADDDAFFMRALMQTA
jgi:hypothetical protein